MRWNVLCGVVAPRLGNGVWLVLVARDVIVREIPIVPAQQQSEEGHLAFASGRVPGYAALVGQPSGVSSYPRHMLIAGPILLLFAVALSRLHVPPRLANGQALLVFCA